MAGWYDSIGQRVAFGSDFAAVRAAFERTIRESPIKGEREHYQDLIRILDYLDEHYTTDSGARIGKSNPRRKPMAGRPLRRARMNGAVSEQKDVTLTPHQLFNLRRLVREWQSELQYLDISAADRAHIASGLDQILGAVLSPHMLD